jgi:fatty-acid desaturase
MVGAFAVADDILSSAVSNSKGDADRLSWRVDWLNVSGLIGFHLLALLALTPWFFSWTGVALAFAGQYVFGMLGINLCYHRLLTHRSFSCPKWLEYILTVLGASCCQDSPAFWVAVHRQHHQHSDDDRDPHSPRVGFFWAHNGWLLLKNDVLERNAVTDRYAPDLMREPFHQWLHQHWKWVVLFSWIGFFAGGFGCAKFMGIAGLEAVQYGIGITLWGAVVRTVLTWHYSNAVNSVNHSWGYRNYETKDLSRNNFVMGVIAHGEGWHNNHHADPKSAMHGHKWWEFDPTFWAIRILVMLGLASNLVMPATGRLNRL